MVDLKGKPFYLNEEAAGWVERTLQSLTLEQKVGQLFMVVEPPFAPPTEQDLLAIQPGGVHIFGFSPEATAVNQAKLIAGLQARSPLPLLVSGDLENGGQGGARDGTNLASNMQVAAAADRSLAEAFGRAIEAEGRAMGFNWVYGPVVDINYNFQNPIVNIRAFGDTPEVVAGTAVPVMQAVQRGGRMAACAKHWPGDGMDDRDQHKVLTVNTMSMERWRSTYGSVFKAMIEEGVKTVMSAHIALPAYYEELGVTDVRTKHTPGSLSYELNTGLLRGELGFNGLIVSDATSMVGMTSFGPRKDIVPQCIASGVDMFLFTQDMRYDFEAMMDGARSGVITEERLNEAVARILALKASLGLHHGAGGAGSSSASGDFGVGGIASDPGISGGAAGNGLGVGGVAAGIDLGVEGGTADNGLANGSVEGSGKAGSSAPDSGMVASSAADNGLAGSSAVGSGTAVSGLRGSGLEIVGCEAHRELAERLARRSVTLVKDVQELLPLSPEKHRTVLLLAASDEASFFGDKAASGLEFEQMLTEEGFRVVREADIRDDRSDVDLVLYLVQKSPGFLQNSMRLSPKEAGGLFTWYPTKVPTLFVSLGNPYTLYEMPSMPAMINAYNATLAVQKEVVRCLVGKQPFAGKSPVDAFCGLEWARL
ncbi:glycoside hydrolase family 3 protein [Paenibacillus chartarius]|uniref:beta-N-acetylhexosaminidase n=1 Tax=Paenibacillus chartarius TaxID=747481 RepID=A0ABV6DR84_9BACL